MAEKKVKIDLKQRLGRASRSSSVPATAPPGIVPPPGIAPPPGIVSPSGIPAPPFPTQRPRSAAVQQDDPFAAVSMGDVAPKPQEIKVEIGHDVVQAKKEFLVKIVIAAAAAATVGIGMGWAFGSMSARANFDAQAIEGAQELAGDVEKADGEIKVLQEKVAAATKSLYKDKKFPAEFSKELSSVEIPFSAANLAGRNLNRLNAKLVRMLFDFARDAHELQSRKDAVRRLFDARKDAIVELLELGSSPKINYVVFVQKDRQSNAVGTFVRMQSAFRFDEKRWPENLKLNTGAEVVDAIRYKDGEPFMKYPQREGDKPTIYAIPLEPDSVAKVFPSPLSERIDGELKSMAQLMGGTTPGTVRPEDEKPGLVKLAEEILRDIRTVGAKR